MGKTTRTSGTSPTPPRPVGVSARSSRRVEPLVEQNARLPGVREDRRRPGEDGEQEREPVAGNAPPYRMSSASGTELRSAAGQTPGPERPPCQKLVSGPPTAQVVLGQRRPGSTQCSGHVVGRLCVPPVTPPLGQAQGEGPPGGRRPGLRSRSNTYGGTGMPSEDRSTSTGTGARGCQRTAGGGAARCSRPTSRHWGRPGSPPAAPGAVRVVQQRAAKTCRTGAGPVGAARAGACGCGPGPGSARQQQPESAAPGTQPGQDRRRRRRRPARRTRTSLGVAGRVPAGVMAADADAADARPRVGPQVPAKPLRRRQQHIDRDSARAGTTAPLPDRPDILPCRRLRCRPGRSRG